MALALVQRPLGECSWERCREGMVPSPRTHPEGRQPVGLAGFASCRGGLGGGRDGATVA